MKKTFSRLAALILMGSFFSAPAAHQMFCTPNTYDISAQINSNFSCKYHYSYMTESQYCYVKFDMSTGDVKYAPAQLIAANNNVSYGSRALQPYFSTCRCFKNGLPYSLYFPNNNASTIMANIQPMSYSGSQAGAAQAAVNYFGPDIPCANSSNTISTLP